MRKFLLSSLSLCSFFVAASVQAADPTGVPADTIFHGGTIVTVNEK